MNTNSRFPNWKNSYPFIRIQPYNSLNEIPKERAGHTSVIYQNKMYIYGGARFFEDSFNDFYSFDLYLKKWEIVNQIGDIPIGRRGHSAIVHLNRMWIFGGAISDEIYTNDFLSFSFETNTWEQVPYKGSILPRMLHKCFLINEKQLVIYGGIDLTGNFLFDLNIFDFESGILTELPPSPSQTDSLNSFLFDQKLFTFDQFFKTTFYFDFQNNQWKGPFNNKGIIPKGYFGNSLSVVDNFVIASCGCLHDFSSTSDIYLFNPKTFCWILISTPQILSPRYQHTSISYKHKTSNQTKVLIFGGCFDQTRCLNDLFELSLPIGDIPQERNSSSLVILEKNAYIFGGKYNSILFNDLFEYNIHQNQWKKIESVGDIPTPRFGASSVLDRNRNDHNNMIIFGGKETKEYSNSLYTLDLKNYQWKCLIQKSQIISPRIFAYSFIYLNEIYVVGGYNLEKDSNELSLFKFSTEMNEFIPIAIQFPEKTHFPIPFNKTPKVFDQGALYVIADELYIGNIDPKKKSLKMKKKSLRNANPPMINKQIQAAQRSRIKPNIGSVIQDSSFAVFVKESIVVFGGFSPNNLELPDEPIIIDVEKKVWKFLFNCNNQPKRISNYSCSNFDNSILYFGGNHSDNDSNSTNTVQILHLESPIQPIIQDFLSLYHNPVFSDFKINLETIDKKPMQLFFHSFIFKERCNFPEDFSSEKIINIIEKFNFEIVDFAMIFVYSSHFDTHKFNSFSFQMLVSLFQLSKQLNLDYISYRCEEKLTNYHLNINNCIDLVQLFDNEKSANSLNIAINFIHQHQEQLFSQMEKFEQLSQLHPHLITKIETGNQPITNSKAVLLQEEKPKIELIQHFQNIFHSSKSTDFTIIASSPIINNNDEKNNLQNENIDPNQNKHLIPVHKSILYSRSKFFHDLFLLNSAENLTVFEENNQISFEAIYHFFRYFYTESLDMNLNLQLLFEIQFLIEIYCPNDYYFKEKCSDFINTLLSNQFQKDQIFFK
ncbi:hypothetical protein M0811_00168 [Anaeramoeba ignava]|uniref:BTB domain-containing protein n=1 Tax=Anaeramoeba ignava TaxID=1746090 RepID=A0A9Q0LT84_ANAIG|nr:hypothetical protein M0811_00168 [Anaeramoeba ignava]